MIDKKEGIRGWGGYCVLVTEEVEIIEAKGR